MLEDIYLGSGGSKATVVRRGRVGERGLLAAKPPMLEDILLHSHICWKIFSSKPTY
jgi:hypothetical protein